MEELAALRLYLPPALYEALECELPTPGERLLGEAVQRLAQALRDLAAHLPSYLVQQVISDPQPGIVQGGFLKGSLLFADISGFTPISEKLSRIGKEGAEEVTALVNRYFRTMLPILGGYGGDVLKFGGDAMLGYFGGPLSAEKAVQAALEMQRAMAAFASLPTSAGVFKLEMKVGIHRGKFFAARMGTAEGMEYAWFGKDVNLTAASEGAARSGQVLVDSRTLGGLVSDFPLESAGHGLFALHPGAELEALDLDPVTGALDPGAEPSVENVRRLLGMLAALKPYLSSGVWERAIHPLAAAWSEGEHRLAATLFTHVEGLGAAVDALGEGREVEITAFLNRAYLALRQQALLFGQPVQKIDLAERGDKLMTFFGAPQAHEDDAERAARAALGMHHWAGELAQAEPGEAAGLVALRSGITYGYLFAGSVGSPQRREYTVMGDDVNLAARLMAYAGPGEVIVSQKIRRRVEALFELESMGEVQVKGKSRLTPIFRLGGLRAEPRRQRGVEGMLSPLVGREAELHGLLHALEELGGGRGRLVTILGEAGLGKSRLVEEAQRQVSSQARQVRRMKFTWAEGRCLSYTETTSYHPIQAVLRRILGIEAGDTAETGALKAQNALRGWLGDQDDQLVYPFLAHFLSLPLSEDQAALVQQMEAQALQRRTFVAIRRLLEAQAQESPLVLVLDDLHWVDEASHKLLEYLLPLAAQQPLLMMMMFRPDRSRRCWELYEKIEREYAYCHLGLQLKPLPAEDSQQLLANLLGGGTAEAEFTRQVFSQAEGNPLYLEEILRSLVDQQVVVREGEQQWSVRATGGKVEVPDTLQGVMMSRLDQLEENSRYIAQAGAVLGRTFGRGLLRKLVQGQAGELQQALNDLQRHEIIHETQRAPEVVYTFHHYLMQEVCYDSLPARRRREYHSRAAALLEQDLQAGQAAAPGAAQALVAHHAYVGQDWPRALRYQFLAGQAAKGLFANLDAIQHFEKARHSLEMCPDPACEVRREQVLLALGELYTLTGQYDAGQECLDAAFASAYEQGDWELEIRACSRLGRLYELRGDYYRAFHWIARGLAGLAGRQNEEAAQLHIQASLICSRQGNLELADEHARMALEIAASLGQWMALGRAHNMLGVMRRNNGLLPAALEHFQHGLENYQKAGDLHGQAMTYNLLANVYFNSGQWAQAYRDYQRARENFQQMGDLYNHAIAENNLGGIALNQGRLEEAIHSYQAARQEMEQIGASAYIQGIIQMNLGAAEVRRGRIPAARALLEESRRSFDAAGTQDFLPEMLRRQAEAEAAEGRWAEAQDAAHQALASAEAQEMRGEQGCSLRMLGEIALAQGDLVQARQQLEQAALLLEQVADEYELACAQLSLAHVLGKLEAGPAARELLERCAGVFHRLECVGKEAEAEALRRALN
jgi:class 3 adenylate cyclase/tetratricopeptide (TPR) repeat protein